MTINHKEALYIAIYLYKGICEKGYNDISIQIAENAVVGFEKKGRSRFRTYVRVNNRYDKSARGNLLTIPYEDYNELATEVKASIENSNLLEGIDLNMSKVPNPSMEILQQLNDDITPETDMDETEIENPIHPDNGFMIEDVSGEKLANSEESHSVSIEEIERYYNKNVTPAPDDEYIKELQKDLENADLCDFTQESSIFTEEMPDEDELQVQDDEPTEEFEDDPEPQNTSDHFMDAMASNKIKGSTATSLQKYNTTHQNSLDAIKKNSYINGIIKSGFDLTPNVEYMFRYLSLSKSEKAADIYINLVCHLATEFDYDISKMSKATGIDERNLMLAMMEKQFN